MADFHSTTASFLTVDDLKVHFPTADGVVNATDGLSFTLERGKTLGIVGESGSGKSVSSSAILGLHRGTSALVSGRILLEGTDLLVISDEQMRQKRGKEVSMISRTRCRRCTPTSRWATRSARPTRSTTT